MSFDRKECGHSSLQDKVASQVDSGIPKKSIINNNLSGKGNVIPEKM
jgi:hypothetical protein